MRTGIIYVLSAFVGTLVAALFIRNSPAVNSSGALFGLLGAMLSELIRDWNVYTDKVLYLLFHWHHPSHLFSVNLANGCIDPPLLDFSWLPYHFFPLSPQSILSSVYYLMQTTFQALEVSYRDFYLVSYFCSPLTISLWFTTRQAFMSTIPKLISNQS